tara:strand:+ start:99 stop:242 length:144 start_codon:yes stop_codon:yes gene_type:complete
MLRGSFLFSLPFMQLAYKNFFFEEVFFCLLTGAAAPIGCGASPLYAM